MNVNVILFDDFENLDAFGPTGVLGRLPEYFNINYLSKHGDIVNSSQGVKLWTEPLHPEKMKDILLVPGGRGARRLIYDDEKTISIIKKSVEHADTCLMVGNGSALLAQTGVLFHRKIADYPKEDNWKRMFSAGISRVPGVRWIADGKFYSSSTSIYAIDMTLGFIADVIDMDVAVRVAEEIGYPWNPGEEDIYC